MGYEWIGIETGIRVVAVESFHWNGRRLGRESEQFSVKVFSEISTRDQCGVSDV